MRIPALPALPMEAKKDKGTLITSAQGQLITRKVKARYIQICQLPSPVVRSPNKGGKSAKAAARPTTVGV